MEARDLSLRGSHLPGSTGLGGQLVQGHTPWSEGRHAGLHSAALSHLIALWPACLS